jgi:Protein of unknown function (DUF3102)
MSTALQGHAKASSRSELSRALVPQGTGLAIAVVGPEPTPPELAAVANREHVLARKAGESMVDHAIRAGKALIAAKAQVSHGEWLPWLETNFEGSEQMAHRYMRVAANASRVTELAEPSLRKALTAVSANGAHVANNSGDNEWYTPTEYIEAAPCRDGRHQLGPGVER